MKEESPGGVHAEVKRYRKHRRNRQHRTLTNKGVPRRINGQKLGRRKRFKIAQDLNIFDTEEVQ